jgi:uncharacterized protein YndB with AHSA1/START domain
VIELSWETDIRASADEVFSLLAGLRDYDRWLGKSAAFRGTHEVSPGPIGAGTTYVEPGPAGTRYGTVTEFDPPGRLHFEQPMTMKPRALGTIGIKVFHTITPGVDGVHLTRRLQLSPSGPVSLLVPLMLGAFRRENERMMHALKEFAEREAASGPRE